jgi:hypothetical protein
LEDINLVLALRQRTQDLVAVLRRYRDQSLHVGWPARRCLLAHLHDEVLEPSRSALQQHPGRLLALDPKAVRDPTWTVDEGPASACTF